MFLGEDLPSWLVLAFGAALAVGNLAALLAPHPPADKPKRGRGDTASGSASDGSDSGGTDADTVERPPLGRSLIMIAIGIAASIWAIASLMN